MVNSGFDVREVGRTYDATTALHGVSLQLRPGARVAILGPSGAGKSTLLRLLAGLEPPSYGQIALDGIVVSRPGEIVVAPHRRSVSMVFQDLALWPNLSALDNVVLGLAASSLSLGARRERAREVLDLVGVGTLSQRVPAALSGGEQQRVALARALAVQPAYLLLDEPFASVDLATKARLFDEIQLLADQSGFALLLVTHDPLEALALCRDALVLEGGRQCESGALPALLEHPQSDTLRAFQTQMSRAYATAKATPAARPP